MIDFNKCPIDEPWYLWDAEGNKHLLTKEVEFDYARLIIAQNRLEGYYVTRVSDTECKDKHIINHYGCIETHPWPTGLFESSMMMAGDIIRASLETKRMEGDKDFEDDED